MTTSPLDNSTSLPPDQYRLKGGKLRPSQIITTFGPGAVVDLPDDSVMIAGIDTWPQGSIIHERRLETALGVEGFRSPAIKNRDGDIPCVRFPRYLVCSNCGLFCWRKKCPECGADTYPARLIVICSEGHADEFPWFWWVHRENRCKGQPVLRLTSQKRTAALADLVVTCDTCKRPRPLSGALGPRGLEGFSCSGKRPWLIDAPPEDNCTARPRSVLRGASNVYFSSQLSALAIPPWSNRIQTELNNHWETLPFLDELTLRAVIKSLPSFSGFNAEDVLQAIRERMNNTTTVSSLRKEEFQAFRNPGGGLSNTDFQIRNEPVPDSFQADIAQVILASRLREVRALRGFTRIDPPDADNNDQKLALIEFNPQPWLPAIEHHGEGIFLELPLQRVISWEKRPQVQRRVNNLNMAYNVWRGQRGLPPTTLLPRFILLHTLAHLLIRQLSLNCGYSSSSLRERIYAGSDMCGLLIYTASADSDGSLGGLVQQGLKDRFGATMRSTLESAQWCSSDPLCTEHSPLRTGKLNGAACHACGLIAETSCEWANRLLDRALVCDLVDIAGTGYFN